jgi:hypothetical protein
MAHTVKNKNADDQPKLQERINEYGPERENLKQR